jgi:hypothetical protein
MSEHPAYNLLQDGYVRRPLIPLDKFYAGIVSRQQFLVKLPMRVSSTTPDSLSLQKYCAPVYDQASLGSCTANAACALLGMLDLMEDPSRLFCYTTTRLESAGTITDAGANCADIPWTNIGVCRESLMPYNVDRNGQVIGFGNRPSKEAYEDAKNHRFPDLVDVTAGDLSGVIKTQVAGLHPVLIAFLVYNNFMSSAVAESGIMPLPGPVDLQRGPVGGHEVLCVGYDITKGLLIQNSWGRGWGQNGFFWMPWAYLTGRQPRYGNFVAQLMLLPGVKVPVSPTPTPNPSPCPCGNICPCHKPNPPKAVESTPVPSQNTSQPVTPPQASQPNVSQPQPPSQSPPVEASQPVVKQIKSKTSGGD